jgi:hypothetical protein
MQPRFTKRTPIAIASRKKVIVKDDEDEEQNTPLPLLTKDDADEDDAEDKKIRKLPLPKQPLPPPASSSPLCNATPTPSSPLFDHDPPSDRQPSAAQAPEWNNNDRDDDIPDVPRWTSK